jgi:FPC/CPF motif-containing protein YcgG
LVTDIPDIREDLLIQTKMFPKLYNMTETLTYPSSEESGFADKVVEWMKLKDKRRGYAKFVTQLFVRELVEENTVGECMTHVSSDLTGMAKQPKTEQSEENTTQYVDFLFETSKILPTSAKDMRRLMNTFIQSVLDIPKSELPSLNMRSRFKLEDALKCVQ